MTTEELNAIRQIMQEELKPINQRLDKIDSRLEVIEEQLDDLNTAVDGIGDWVEKASYVVRIPYADTPAGQRVLNQMLKEQASET